MKSADLLKLRKCKCTACKRGLRIGQAVAHFDWLRPDAYICKHYDLPAADAA